MNINKYFNLLEKKEISVAFIKKIKNKYSIQTCKVTPKYLKSFRYCEFFTIFSIKSIIYYYVIILGIT